MSGEFSHGDAVIVALGGTAYAGRAEMRFIGPWPEKREELFICIPGRFPYRLHELASYGAAIEAKERTDERKTIPTP